MVIVGQEEGGGRYGDVAPRAGRREEARSRCAEEGSTC